MKASTCLAVLGLVATPGMSAAAAAAPTGSAFLIDGVLPDYLDMALSPSGRYVAALYQLPTESGINVVDLATSTAHRTRLMPEDGVIVDAVWKGDDRLLSVAQQQFTGQVMLSSDRPGTDVRIVSHRIRDLRGEILSWLPQDPEAVLIAAVSYDDMRVDKSSPYFDLNAARASGHWGPAYQSTTVRLGAPTLKALRLDVLTGRSMPMVAKKVEPKTAVGFLFNAAGELRYAVQADKDGKRVLLRPPGQDDDWRAVAPPSEDRALQFVGLNEQDIPLVLAAQGRDTVGVHLLDIVTGQPAQRLVEAAGADIGAPLRNPADGTIIGYTYVTNRVEVIPADPLVRGIAERVGREQEGSSVSVISVDSARKRAIVLIESWPVSRAYVLVNTESGEITRLTRASTPVEITVQQGRIPVSDGVELPVMLMLPANGASQTVPLVARPIGPLSFDRVPRDNQQIIDLVRQGYGVATVVTRGSRGLGSRFRDAGKGAIGPRAVEDLIATVEWAARTGKVDTSRVAVLGSFQDADLALYSVSRSVHPFKCAVANKPTADLEKHANKIIKLLPEAGQDDWKFLFGDVGGDRTRSQSPMTVAEQVAVPVFVSYVQEDYAADYTRRLKKLGKVVTEVEIRSSAARKPRGVDYQAVPTRIGEFLHACLS